MNKKRGVLRKRGKGLLPFGVVDVVVTKSIVLDMDYIRALDNCVSKIVEDITINEVSNLLINHRVCGVGKEHLVIGVEHILRFWDYHLTWHNIMYNDNAYALSWLEVRLNSYGLVLDKLGLASGISNVEPYSVLRKKCMVSDFGIVYRY